MSVWLITGSSRGFGRALVQAALERGHSVVATARRPEQLRDFVAAHPNDVLALPLDVTDAGAVKVAIRTGVERFGRLELETDLWGVINVTRAALPILHQQRSEHIVQFSSIAGRMGVAGLGAYQAAKWAVEGFSEALAREVAPLGIKVTIIEPGAFRTEYSAAASAGIRSGELEIEGATGKDRRNATQSD